MSTRHLAIALFAATVAAVGCAPGGQRRAGRLPPRAKERRLPSEVPTEPIVLSNTLARARWVVVTTAPKIDEPLPERLAKEAPAVVSHILDAHDGAQITPKDLAELRRLAFGRRAPPEGSSVRVPAEELIEEGWDPPARSVWMIGPQGPCMGAIGDGFVGTYDDRRFLEIAWEVTGCAPSEWAQVGLVVDDPLPSTLRWVAAQTLVRSDLEHGKPWDHALAEHVPAPYIRDPQRPPQRDLVRVRAVPGTVPMATQILAAHQWWLEPAFDDHTGAPIGDLQERCVAEESRAQARGNWGEDGFLPYGNELHVGQSFPVLVGAFVEGETVRVLVWRVGIEGSVTVPAPSEGGELGWIETRLRLGFWQPEPASTWDWGVGPRCTK
jgi:hypothetical protein